MEAFIITCRYRTLVPKIGVPALITWCTRLSRGRGHVHEVKARRDGAIPSKVARDLRGPTQKYK